MLLGLALMGSGCPGVAADAATQVAFVDAAPDAAASVKKRNARISDKPSVPKRARR